MSGSKRARTALHLPVALFSAGLTTPAQAGTPEKDTLTPGFIKRTDMAPLAIARAKGFFEKEGLTVTLETQPNWKVLLYRILAGETLASTIGYGTKGDLIAPIALDLNGNAITVPNAGWAAMTPGISSQQVAAAALKPVLEAYADEGRVLNFGMVLPVSPHNYELRYWLAGGGFNPGLYAPDDNSGRIGADVLLSVTPPPQMPATLEAGTIDGYSVGEPSNQAAVAKGIGVLVIADDAIFHNNPEKVFGLTGAFAAENPETVKALAVDFTQNCPGFFIEN